MKKNELQNGAYKILHAQFKTHLQTLNYSEGTIKSSQMNSKEFLHYLENNHIPLQQATTREITEYFNFLQTSINKNTGLGLSTGYIQKIRSDLKVFYEFLHLTQKQIYPSPVFPEIKGKKPVPRVLTKEEVQKLFKACDDTLLGKRNKAILAIYYGSGLRRQEGTNLNIEDLDLNKGSLFIAKTKTRRQRNVPISTKMQQIIEDYLFNVREKLIDKDLAESAVLVTERGKRLTPDSVTYILQKLVKESKITTAVSAHTLRHSIATHFLQSGMQLESIALFLGHKSLDSTQIYTHLSNQRP